MTGRFITAIRFPITICGDHSRFYYIHSESLWGITPNGDSPKLRLEENIPVFDYPLIGKQINPAYIAWWGLINLNHHLNHRDDDSRRRLTASIQWMVENIKQKGECLVWTYDFDWPHGDSVMKAPWISGLSQALAASLLFRSAPLLNDQSLFDKAVLALEIFKYPLTEGGLKSSLNGYDFYEEYPVFPCTYVLDGALFGLLAFYDLYRTTGDDRLFNSALDGIVNNLDYWDYHDVWSYYGNFGYLSSFQYHCLNLTLLQVLCRLTDDLKIQAKVSSWNRFQHSIAIRWLIGVSYFYTNSRYTITHRVAFHSFIRRRLDAIKRKSMP